MKNKLPPETREALKMRDQWNRAFERAIERQIDHDWKEYVKPFIERAKISNNRLFRLITAIKGEDLTKDIKGLMRAVKDPDASLRVARQPKGVKLKDSRFKTIPFIWVNQRQSGIYGKPEGELYIQIKENRWIWFYYVLH